MKKDEMIENLFSQDNIETPEALSKWNMINQINEKEIKPQKVRNISVKKILSLAASLVIVFAVGAIALRSHYGQNAILTETITVNDTQMSQEVTEKQIESEINTEADINPDVPVGEDAEKIKEHFRTLYKNAFFVENYCYDDGWVIMDMNDSVGAAAPDSAPAVGSSTNGSVEAREESKNYSHTNIQYKTVDEGDIIKNDGRYIYVVSGKHGANQQFKIVDTDTMKVVATQSVKCKDGTNAYIQQLYVNGNTLVVICNENASYYSNRRNKPNVTINAVFDITDKTKPELIKSVVQDGSFSSSRMIGTVLYTLTNYNVYGESEEEVIKNCIPMVNGAYVGCDCIYIENEQSTSYIVLTATDTVNEGKSETVCVLGGGDGVYCSENNFYALDIIGEETSITAFSIDGTEIKYKTTGKIKGKASDQYYYDEYKGFLRVATTYYDSNKDASVSDIHILDGNLKEVSCLKDIATDERVESARFMGDMGYVVTFRDTDPLFTLDLSDPYNPKIKGELKLPGFSDYLHPLSDGLILGFGYDGDDSSADYDTLKISLFDISDAEKPKHTDSIVIKNADTELHYSAKALLYNADKKEVSIPVTQRNTYNSDRGEKKFITISVVDYKLEITAEYNHNQGDLYSNIFRGVYIGESFYTLCDKYVIEYDINTGNKKRSCELINEQEKQNVDGTAVVYEYTTSVTQ